MNWPSIAFGCAVAAALGTAVGAGLGPGPDVVLDLDGHPYALSATARPELAEALRIRAARLSQRQIYLRAGSELVCFDAGELGFELDVKTAFETISGELRAHQEASASRVASSLFRRLTRNPEHISAHLPHRLDEATARRALQKLARRVDRPPQDAELLIDEHRIIPSRWGAQLSVEATLVRLARLQPEPALVVDAVVEPLRPDVTEEELSPVDVTQVLASFETSFRGKAGPRAVNIRNAARYLDGAVIMPGETLSFNHRVGRRIHGRGFVDAPVIVNDEMEDDVGGGVCQVATTLHGAAVYGNLEIVRRRSHSRPSGYAPIGLDATVIDGKVDLEIQNPYDEPLLVHTTFPSRYLLRVEILGRRPSAQIEHASVVQNSEPFARRVWFKEGLPPGSFERKQKGSPGMDVLSVLRIKRDTGDPERRTYRSKYYPVPEVFYAGPGTPLTALPPLPDGATGVVIDGQEIDGQEGPELDRPRDSAGSLSPRDVPRIDEADSLGRQADRAAGG